VCARSPRRRWSRLSLARAEGPARLAALQRRVSDAELDALIVTDPTSIHYLTGFSREAHAIVLVAVEWAAFLTVEGFSAEADDIAPGWESILVPRGLWPRATTMLHERLSPTARIGFQSEQVTHAVFTQVTELLSALSPELVAADDQLSSLRAVKSDAELALLRVAAAPLEATFEWLYAQQLTGMTERQLAWAIERRLREQHGADALAFETVVAWGPHGASPHHTASDTVIEPGALLVVDIGCVIDGYRSDMTRTLAVGPPDPLGAEIHAVVRSAQGAALERLVPGVVGDTVHAAAAEVIDAAGPAGRFPHGVGHGIGLELHEAPYCDEGAMETLAAGHVVTVEPGVYVPGCLGVRIEDEVVITQEGHERLTSLSSELVVCR
jgi:Xaa-Pro aminopeptidase